MIQPPPPLTPQLSPVSDVNAPQAAAQAAADLRESEEKFRAFFENSLDAILLTSPDGSIQAANPAACRMFGRTEAEICALGRDGLVDAADPRLAALLVERARAGRAYGELTMFRADGVPFPVEISSVLFQDSQGRAHTSMIIRDITERKQAEEALKESEERFSTAFFTSPVAQSIITQNSNEIMAVNDACCRLFGYRREELIGASTAKLSLWESPADRLAAVEELQRTGHLLPREATIRVKSGEIRTVIVAIAPISWKRQACFISSVFDITERKQTEEALRESEFRYRELFDNINSGVAVYQVVNEGRDFVFKDFNRAGERIDHDSRERLIGKSIFEVRPGIAEFGLLDVFRQVWQTGQPVAHPMTQYKDDHLTGWYENFVYKISPNEIVTVFDNITERKRAEEEIRRLNAELEQRVADRTAELRRIVNLMVGRELRMAELKEVIRQLRQQVTQAGLRPVADDPLHDNGSIV